MNPGVSVASTTTLPQRSSSMRSGPSTLGAVVRPGISSTSGSSGAGLKKWTPHTRPGSRQPPAIAVTASDEVLVPNTQSSLTSASSRRNAACLVGRSSRIASITSAQCLKIPYSPALPGAQVMRSWSPLAASAASLPFWTSRVSTMSSRERACSSASALASVTSTWWPAAAATWAIPLPIAPAPSTPTVASGPRLTSFANEGGLSLLEKRLHPLGIVLTAAGETLIFGLELELLFQRVVRRSREHLLDQRQGVGRLGGELRRQAEGRGFELRGWADLIDEV